MKAHNSPGRTSVWILVPLTVLSIYVTGYIHGTLKTRDYRNSLETTRRLAADLLDCYSKQADLVTALCDACDFDRMSAEQVCEIRKRLAEHDRALSKIKETRK